MSFLKTLFLCLAIGGVAQADNPGSVDYIDQQIDQQFVSTNQQLASIEQQLAPGTYEIGDYAEGGVIFWLSPDKKHGIVASIDNMGGSGAGSTYKWSSDEVLIRATANTMAFGDNYETAGQINTALILAHYEGSAQTAPAAQACAAYSVTVNGVTYDDWYLPSIEELGMMRLRRDTINSVSVAQGGAAFASDDYWSSLEEDADFAWAQFFTTGGSQLFDSKSFVLARVRAARAF